MLIKLSNTETQIEHLKSQLDDTLGTEKMLVSDPMILQLIGPPEMEHRNLKKCGSLLKTLKLSKNSVANLEKTIWKLRRPCKRKLGRNHLFHIYRALLLILFPLDAKDTQIQEHAQKILTLEDACQDLDEFMECCMEAVKKQADTIIGLEIELSKVRRQERVYKEAMEQLQANLDVLEQSNAKLKVMAAPEKQGQRSAMFGWLHVLVRPIQINSQRLVINPWSLIMHTLRVALRCHIHSNRLGLFIWFIHCLTVT